MDNQPLVSVVVASYNAEHTVLETLESVRNQSYENIELILSDDCSKDNTISIAQRWFEKNAHYFKGGAHLLTAEKNQGVCANFNKAIRSSKGDWIKIIAADDILLPNCCEDYVNYILSNTNAQFVTSYVDYYQNTFEDINCVRRKVAVDYINIFEASTDVQLKEMAYKIFVMAPTMFFSRSVFEEVGGFDENYIYEDHPFYVNLLEHGHKLYFADCTTVGYRIHDSTVNSNIKLFNYRFSQNSKKFRIERCFKYYTCSQRFATRLYYLVLDTYERFGWNKKTKFTYPIFDTLIGIIWKIGRL